MTTSSATNPGPTPYTNQLVHRMFIATADQNYATARWAFLNEQYVDFFWLSLHAVEKYLKAILLLNGRSARKHGHDIERLSRAVYNLDTRLSFGQLTRPAPVPVDVWRDEPMADFISRVNDMGDPSNRYMLYGYVLRPDDLFKVDQLVWAVRRHCRPLRTPSRAGQPDIDWITALERSPANWNLSGALPLEKAATGRANSELERVLFNLNYAFAPERQHLGSLGHFASANPPLADWFDRLRNDQASPETRQAARETFLWVLRNVALKDRDKQEIEEALKQAAPKDN